MPVSIYTANQAGALAVANMNGMAFTIDDTETADYEVTAWQPASGPSFHIVAGQMTPGCSGSCTAPTVAAASLPGGLVATAVVGANQNLSVAVWLFL